MSTREKATGVFGMPAPGSSHTPDFDSTNPEDLKEILEEFEELAEECGLTKKEKAKVLVQYVDKGTKKFWKRLEGFGEDYEKLKNEITGAYSKTLLNDKPTVAELVKLVKGSAKGVIEDKEDLDAYYRRFWIVAADLMEASVIHDKRRDEYFWKGIPRDLRYAISDRLEACDADFESDQVPEMTKVMEAGRFVLRKAAARGGWDRLLRKGKRTRKVELSEDGSDNEAIGVETGSELDSDGERVVKKSGKEIRAKKVRFKDGEGKEKDVEGQVEELTRRLLRLDATYATAYAQLFVIAPDLTDKFPIPSQFNTAAVTNATAIPTRSTNSQLNMLALREFLCHFCKRSVCRIKTCPFAAEYVRLGRVILQPNGYYAHTDSTRIEHHPGGLKAAIDIKLGLNNAAATTQPTQRDCPPHMPTTPSTPSTPSAFILFVRAVEVEDNEEFNTLTEAHGSRQTSLVRCLYPRGN
ncbi:hypothetical protein AN958_06962 [Leucoagaricus sp. SymC.cos]|nr:hypothetical protein AN958_06962 [Leucoagaricus sp. SymC.cos]